jgi:hypothetical protein
MPSSIAVLFGASSKVVHDSVMLLVSHNLKHLLNTIHGKLYKMSFLPKKVSTFLIERLADFRIFVWLRYVIVFERIKRAS